MSIYKEVIIMMPRFSNKITNSKQELIDSYVSLIYEFKKTFKPKRVYDMLINKAHYVNIYLEGDVLTIIPKNDSLTSVKGKKLYMEYKALKALYDKELSLEAK